jgi:hypothetical protein
MNNSVFFALAIAFLALVALRFVPLLRWVVYPIAAVMSLDLVGGNLIGFVGAALFAATYAMGKLQGRSYDRYQERIAAGERVVCRTCRGSGKESDPFARIMRRCPECSGSGWRG